MAPARKIPLRCRAPLADAARAILQVRVSEVEYLQGQVTGAGDSEVLHDLRIAAKRLRYSLETFAVCFPPGEANSYANRVRSMQDILGRIHDLDVLETLLMHRLALMDSEARRLAVEVASAPADKESRLRLLQDVVARSDAGSRIGLLAVIGDKADERRERYREFEALWAEWQSSGLLEAIEQQIE